MLVSIIIINYNTLELTAQCVRSVYKFTQGVAFEIIVVDNASPDDDPDLFLTEFPEIRLVKSDVNGGFAHGNNLGIEAASGDVILLLNSDTYLTSDSITEAAQALNAKPQVAALSVRLLYEDGRYQNNARRFRSIKNEMLDLLRPLLMLMPYKKRARLMLNQYFHGDFDVECDWVSGAFLMFRKGALDEFPGKKLDERYFMYGEDHLWCWQWRQAGKESYFVSTTSVIHIANASTSPEKQVALLKTIIGRELDIMRLRKGQSFYYYIFKAIFSFKELARYRVKWLFKKLSGKMLR